MTKKQPTISDLKEQLEDLINIRLAEFKELAAKAKKLTQNLERKDKIDRVYLNMAKLAMELEPVQELVRFSNPTYPKFFAALIEFYDKKTKKEDHGK